MEHAADAPAWVLALEHSALGQSLRQSLWLYPLINVGHVLAMALLVGAITAYDLRILGAARGIAADKLARLLLPLAGGGLAVALATGILLFIADAGAIWNNTVFPFKLALIGLGLANIAAFHGGLVRTAGALVSLLVWPAVLVLGRLIAYY